MFYQLITESKTSANKVKFSRYIHSMYSFSAFIQCIHSMHSFSAFIRCIHAMHSVHSFNAFTGLVNWSIFHPARDCEINKRTNGTSPEEPEFETHRCSSVPSWSRPSTPEPRSGTRRKTRPRSPSVETAMTMRIIVIFNNNNKLEIIAIFNNNKKLKIILIFNNNNNNNNNKLEIIVIFNNNKFKMQWK